jgi:hypothetical protein
MRHLGPLALFGALAIAWTWPLSLHLHDAIPGGPGDNYSFVWNLWWMRHVLATPGLAYFHTNYLFYPFGTTIADHPHTALPAFVAATLLRPLTVVEAQNVLLIAYIFANMAAMYALAWDVLTTINAEPAEHAARTDLRGFSELSVVRRGAILAAVIFGLSPYFASHLLGHFDLIAGFVLPLFALMVRRALNAGSARWAAGAGLVFAATAYTVYYYVVYLAFFLAVYLIVWIGWTPVRWTKRVQSPQTRRIQLTVIALATALGVTAIWIIVSGGRILDLGPGVISVRTPQNALTGIWICVIAYALCIWRLKRTRVPLPAEPARRAFVVGAWTTAVFLLAAAPLLWQAAQLLVRHEYVTPAYQWRSAPRGVDLIAPLLGPPLTHWTERIYAVLGMDRVEAVGWLGIVPLILLGSSLVTRNRTSRDIHLWRIVAAVFGVWALGPILTIAGFDTGLKLPATLLRYLPFVANARMPGRAIVVVVMAMAVLAAAELASGRRWWRAPVIQWLVIAVVALEYWNAPILLTALDRPPVYAALAAAPPGAVCEVPFGVGDGLSAGVGSQDRRILYYATLHEHPLAGGYIGRMPADAADRYAALPVTAPLLRLSDGAGSAVLPAGESPCRYLVVHRAAASAALRGYVATLQSTLLASDDARDLYRINSRMAR